MKQQQENWKLFESTVSSKLQQSEGLQHEVNELRQMLLDSQVSHSCSVMLV